MKQYNETDKFISIKNRNDKSKKDNFFFVFYYRYDSHATKYFTRFHWMTHDHVVHELYCHSNINLACLSMSSVDFTCGFTALYEPFQGGYMYRLTSEAYDWNVTLID
jgi:hypothetical protein